MRIEILDHIVVGGKRYMRYDVAEVDDEVALQLIQTGLASRTSKSSVINKIFRWWYRARAAKVSLL